MNIMTIVFERIPLVWFLLGLLFISTGLYLGFDYSLSFVYLLVGAGCCAFGLAIFAFRFMERPKQTSATRLSPDFVSAGSTVAMPSAPPIADKEQETAHSPA